MGLIDKQRLLAEARKLNSTITGRDKPFPVAEAFMDIIKKQPIIGAGRGAVWYKPTGMMPPEFAGQYRCSNCNELAMRDWKHHRQTLTNFCPYCGKNMQEEKDDG